MIGERVLIFGFGQPEPVAVISVDGQTNYAINYNAHETYFEGFVCYCWQRVTVTKADFCRERIIRSIIREEYTEDMEDDIIENYNNDYTNDDALEAMEELVNLTKFAGQVADDAIKYIRQRQQTTNTI